MSVNRKIHIFIFYNFLKFAFLIIQMMVKLRHLVNTNFAFLKHTVQPVCNIKYVYILQNNI